MVDSSEKRNTIRSAIFSAKPEKKLVNFFGQEVEVRTSSLKEILEVQENEDRKEAIVQIMIRYCYVPGTEEHVFEIADKDSILKLPAGKWLTDMNKAVTELTDINIDDTEKN